MKCLPSCLLCSHDVLVAIVDKQYFFTTEPHSRLNLGEEVRFGLLCSEHRGIEYAINVLSQAQLSHQVGGS